MVDGGDIDAAGQPDAGPITCTVNPSDVHALGTDSRLGERVLGLAASATRFAVLWNETRAGRPDIFGRTFSRSGLDPEARLTDTTSRENAPTIVASGTQWIASWTDNEGSVGFDLRAQLLASDLSDAGARHTVTDTARLLEDAPLLARTAAGPILGWIEDDMVAFTREARLVRLGEDGTPMGTVQAVSETGRSPGRLALGELTGGPAVFWTERAGGPGQEVLMQPLDPAGARVGMPTGLTEMSNGDGSVDVALDVAGGAFVFGVQVGGVRNEVRFRGVSGDGMLTGAERVLTPMGGRDPSLAFFAGGYAVTYRDTSGATPRIMLMLVTSLGDVVAEEAVADAAAGGGRTTVRVSGEGDIGVAWADDAGGEVQLRAALVRCGS